MHSTPHCGVWEAKTWLSVRSEAGHLCEDKRGHDDQEHDRCQFHSCRDITDDRRLVDTGSGVRKRRLNLVKDQDADDQRDCTGDKPGECRDLVILGRCYICPLRSAQGRHSTLYERFEEYRRSRAIASKSEATRELLKSGLETELDYAGGRTIIDGNESLLLSLAFIVSAEDLLSVMITVGGTVSGTIVFAAAGTLLVSWLLADYQPDIIFKRLRRVRS